ncbi:fluoroquinolone transport system permease protein [Natranaerovirga hydrolytica]|uniref:Fluoroquinolone transport system permease protein n=1 Tax=Natranaerovirga hydrolytica TaxID=680378 RepID=A0A4R1MZB9_9FIRM|nr:hypothetical protein [Natranaerovirga hydrolytica]TCK98678.1 fluoroquinolone transport system permease protein [Natranaerovirga hydrolytica]
MVKHNSFEADIKTIIREPVLILFFIMPIFIFLIFKALLIFGEPVLLEMTGFDLSQYYSYVLGVTFLISPMMLGTVAGFVMIDERDAKIYELIAITPIGYVNYMVNRLLFPVVGSFLYTILAYNILNVYTLNRFVLLLISIFISIQAIIMGLLLFNLADDKVKGLTYSKGFGTFNLLALADLINNRWVVLVASATPFYWIVRLIKYYDVKTIVMSVVIHIVWLGGVILLNQSRSRG